jgi:hypothetical protein
MTNTGDILRDDFGYFFRVDNAGMLQCLSSSKAYGAALPLVTLVHNGQPTGHGDHLATKCAMGLARRYA